jgi:hypothetical protein
MSVAFYLYIHVECIACHVAVFLNFQTKALMFVGNILLENNSPFEEHNTFIHSYMFK